MKWILLGHIFFATIWFGGHVFIEAVVASAKRSGDPAVMATTVTYINKASDRLFPTAAILTLGFGIWLVLGDGSVWEFSDLFVTIGFTVTIIGIALGIFYMTPKSKKLAVLLADKDPGDPEVKNVIAQTVMASHIGTLLVVVAIVAMVIKPGL